VALSARFEKEGQRPGANGPFTIRGETASGLRAPPARCCSSVVEHSLGKGEVVSSILTNSTIFPEDLFPFISIPARPWDMLPAPDRLEP
jgi:hypothetical protein